MGASCLGLLGNYLYQTEVVNSAWEGEGNAKQKAFVRYYERLLDRFPSQVGGPLAVAQMHAVLGDTYRVQEDFASAYRHLDAASAQLAVDDPRGVSTDSTRLQLVRHIRHERLLCMTCKIDTFSICRAVRLANPKSITISDAGNYSAALPLYEDEYVAKHGPAWSADRSEPLASDVVSLVKNPGTQGVDDPTLISRYKLMHDIEQLEHLGEKGALPAEVAELVAEDLRAAYRMTAGHTDENAMFVASGSLIRTMNKHISYLNRNLYAPHETLLKKMDNAVNPELDTDQISDDYHANGVGMTFIDDFLTKEAVARIRTFCEDATIWHETKDGYLAAWMADGFHGELLFQVPTKGGFSLYRLRLFQLFLLQIAEEMRTKFPSIFKDHQLGQMWAFKYNSVSNARGCLCLSVSR